MKQPAIYTLLPILLTLWLAAGSIPAAASSNSRIEHIVLCGLKTPTTENRDRVIENVRDLAAIPGVMDLRVGPVLESDREVVDDSFDVGISMSFKNRGDMEHYLTHEEHVRRLEEVFVPLCGDIRVFDFTY